MLHEMAQKWGGVLFNFVKHHNINYLYWIFVTRTSEVK